MIKLPVFILSGPVEKIGIKRRNNAEIIAKECNGIIIDGIYDDETKFREIDKGTVKIHPNFHPSTGQLGCILGHIRILKKIVEEKIDKSIILEDDAKFSSDDLDKYSKELLSAPEYDLYYLWYPYWEENNLVKDSDGKLLTHQPFRPLFSIVAYSITYDGAKKVLKQLQNMCYHAIDIMYIAMVLNNNMKAYMTSIPIKSLGCQYQAAIDDGSTKNEFKTSTPPLPTTLSLKTFNFNNSIRNNDSCMNEILSSIMRHKNLRSLNIDISIGKSRPKPNTFNILFNINSTKYDLGEWDYVISSEHVTNDNYLEIPQWFYYTQELTMIQNRKLTRDINQEYCGFIIKSAIENVYDKISSYKNISTIQLNRNNNYKSMNYMSKWISNPETYSLPEWRAYKMFKLCNKYKFFLCTGQYTEVIENILHAYCGGCIPIIYSDSLPYIKRWFNQQSFISIMNDSKEEISRVLEKIKYIDNNNEEYIKVRNMNVFTNEALEYMKTFNIDTISSSISQCYEKSSNMKKAPIDFVFIQGYDSKGEDLYHKNKDTCDILSIAVFDYQCVAVNTLGFFKHKVTLPLVKSEYFRDHDGIYIKKDYYESLTKKGHIYYSQQGEDVYIHNNYINKFCDDGIFVEIGGMDGIKYSNTKFFEDSLGFKGVLIEPTNMFINMQKNRQKCDCYNIAVNYNKGKIKFVGDNATAGITEYMADEFKNFYHKNSYEYYVDCEPFSDILAKSKITYIDLLSIDVEGAEQVVLETMNWDIPIYVIVIELDGHNKIKDSKCRDILRKNGFIFDIRMCINEFWINKNYSRIHKLYDNTVPKFEFKTIYELGEFRFLSQHVIDKVEKCLQNVKTKKTIKVKMIGHWWANSKDVCDDFNWMSPNRDYTWKNDENIIKLVWDDDPDYYIIVNKPPNNCYYDPKKTIVFPMEPIALGNPNGAHTWGKWYKPNKNKFLHVHGRPEIINVQWNLKIPYNMYANDIQSTSKNINRVASIVSHKNWFVGHKLRTDFIKFVQSKTHTLFIDVYGKQNYHNFTHYSGQLKNDDRASVLIPYKYYFMCENNSEINYATEKIWEPILCECLCFYWGCPNLDDYIDNKAYIQLDLNDFESSLDTIQRAIKEDWWSQRLHIIRQEKKKILNDLGFFPALNKIIRKVENKQ